MTTQDVLVVLSHKLAISKYRLVRFGQWKYLQDYLPNTTENKQTVSHVIELSHQTGLPFWDSALLTISLTESDYLHSSEDIIERADHHSPIVNDFWLDAAKLKELIINNNENIGINSLVENLEGNFMHIPMMDFHLPVSEKNLLIVKQICDKLGMANAYILDSGNSYHLIGDRLIGENELIDFLSKGLLYGPITDTRWIAHQILERSCTLRLTPKNGIVPTVTL